MKALNVHKRKKELYDTVYGTVHSLDQLIDPSEVTEHAETWSDVSEEELEREIHQSVKMNLSESNYDNLVKGMAIYFWLHEMPRVKLEDLVFDSTDEALKNGYWPYNLSVMGAEAKLYDMTTSGDISIPNTARNQAHSIAKSAVADKLDPRVDEPQLT